MEETMMRIFFSCTLLSTVFCHAAFGQVDANTCVRLANVIAVGNATHISDEQYNAMRYYANCEASQSGTSAGLDVAYQAFSLGAKYSDAKRNEYCSKSYDSYNIRTMDYNT